MALVGCVGVVVASLALGARREVEALCVRPFYWVNSTPGIFPRLTAGLRTKEQTGMAKKRKASNLDTPTCHLATTSLIALITPRRS